MKPLIQTLSRSFPWLACVAILIPLAPAQDAGSSSYTNNAAASAAAQQKAVAAAQAAQNASVAANFAAQNAAIAARNATIVNSQQAANAPTVTDAGLNPGTLPTPNSGPAYGTVSPAGGVQVDRTGVVVPGNAGINPASVAPVRAPTLTLAPEDVGRLVAPLHRLDTLNAIASATRADRDTVLLQVKTRMEEAAHSAAELHRETNDLKDEARERFDAMYATLREREKALRSSLKAAQRAGSASAWNDAQSRLASDYQAYAEAVARVESAAGQHRK